MQVLEKLLEMQTGLENQLVCSMKNINEVGEKIIYVKNIITKARVSWKKDAMPYNNAWLSEQFYTLDILKSEKRKLESGRGFQSLQLKRTRITIMDLRRIQNLKDIEDRKTASLTRDGIFISELSKLLITEFGEERRTELFVMAGALAELKIKGGK